ncbi:MAG: magnesium/cobalt transporter CorA [Verrucomicrobiota bacterium]
MKQPLESAKDVANAASGAVFKTAGFLASTIKGIGKGVFLPITSSLTPTKEPEPGAAPGIEHYLKHEREDMPVRITVTDYGEGFHETAEFAAPSDALAHPKRETHKVRWINVDGLKPSAVDAICKHFGIHTLAAEDVLNTYQRPKLEEFDDHILVVARQLHLQGNSLKNEQISFFMFADTLLSFQEEVGDVFDPVRKRLETKTGRFRTYAADYLFYALLDSIVDHLFPLLEGYGAALEDLEFEILKDPTPASQGKLFAMKRDLSLQRRALWPIREVIDHLYRYEGKLIHEDLRTFFRDVQDHAMQVIDLLETYRDTASGLSDLYQSSVGNKMNEIMKVLTIMASFFIPVTFVAGVYGMNFEYIPELSWRPAYFVFWGVCLSVTGALAFFFWRKGWIGGKGP